MDKRRTAPQDLRVRLGRALRDERKAAGMSQEDLADKAKVPQPNVSYWERGEREPSLEDIARLEAALKLTRGYLLVAAGCIDLADGVRRAVELDPGLTRVGREVVLDTYDIQIRRGLKGRDLG